MSAVLGQEPCRAGGVFAHGRTRGPAAGGEELAHVGGVVGIDAQRRIERIARPGLGQNGPACGLVGVLAVQEFVLQRLWRAVPPERDERPRKHCDHDDPEHPCPSP
ncbi:hypothetical protein [Coralloluteibacterium thermophilus]|uniref:Uncharacterized protein n=1 Tax=Coralloluteibacterium thermophilum TaxID=2707049 RepID=A0ABV9NN77_9GAMM